MVYQILAYLCVRLKAGEKIDTKLLQAESNYLNIHNLYWSCIIENLYRQGLATGVNV
nr:YjcQ family protein [Allofustis seminis]